jgi:hypothetical protein
LTRASSELFEDDAASLAEYIASEIGYSFSAVEDDATVARKRSGQCDRFRSRSMLAARLKRRPLSPARLLAR